MRNSLMLFILCLVVPSAMAQTGIGTKIPDGNSVLDVSSNTKGMLIPRLSGAEVTTLANKNPSEGMVIYNTEENCIQIYKGTTFECLTVNSEADRSRDAWADDSANDQIKLETKSDGSSVRDDNTDFVIEDDGKVGIGTGFPNADAQLDISATDKGVLIPRIELTSTTAASPLRAHVAGMMVYNTATVGDISPGFYYNNGTVWLKVADMSQTDNTKDAWMDDRANERVELGVQSDGSTARAAGSEVVVTDLGEVGIGSNSPTSKLQVAGLPVFVDNAAAIAEGLTAGAFYHSGDGIVRVVF
ncbi:hypothetical protein FKX85_00860 [Echinicola soli]|uniref:Uncharacterized protein n=1 Tax=Echinicola soli TaxID=2591634 RepID=A0A514CCX7_9BACT|nr:hypothetical protein [Echinicola soli]QDH77671.1 hypothetical protein FKX85_00860 [Echinicola soli]